MKTNGSLAKELANTTSLCALKKGAFGKWRSYDDEERATAAQAFDADPEYTRGAKKILNDKCEQYRAVMSILSQARTVWVGMTIPYPEAGRRLIRRDKIEEFKQKMEAFKASLATAVGELNEVFDDLREEAKERLKDLFSPGDYPTSLVGEFSIEYEFPSAAPPEFLKTLSPELYAREEARLTAKFDEAITLAESAFAAEFAKAVRTLMERLSPATVRDWTYAGPSGEEIHASLAELQAELDAKTKQLEGAEEAVEAGLLDAITTLDNRRDRLNEQLQLYEATSIEQRGGGVKWKSSSGKRMSVKLDIEAAATQWLTDCGCEQAGERHESKRISDASVGNLQEFFGRFKDLSIRSNPVLDELIAQAQAAVGAVNAEAIRADSVTGELRTNLSSTLTQIGEAVDELIVSGGGRRIVFGRGDE